MREVAHNDGFAVYDDFLSNDSAASIREFMSCEDYTFLHTNNWHKAWRLTDGEPLVGKTYYSDPPDKLPRAALVAPSGTAMHDLFSEIKAIVGKVNDVLGLYKTDWGCIAAIPYIHSVGTGLGWHEDGDYRAGAFTYYSHKTWKASWGGELCIMNTAFDQLREEYISYKMKTRSPAVNVAEAPKRRSVQTPPHCEQYGPDFIGAQDLFLSHSGLGQFIMPKPNRLVFISGKYSHSINKVHPAAGENPRCSVSGFFLKLASSSRSGT